MDPTQLSPGLGPPLHSPKGTCNILIHMVGSVGPWWVPITIQWLEFYCEKVGPACWLKAKSLAGKHCDLYHSLSLSCGFISQISILNSGCVLVSPYAIFNHYNQTLWWRRIPRLQEGTKNAQASKWGKQDSNHDPSSVKARALCFCVKESHFLAFLTSLSRPPNHYLHPSYFLFLLRPWNWTPFMIFIEGCTTILLIASPRFLGLEKME